MSGRQIEGGTDRHEHLQSSVAPKTKIKDIKKLTEPSNKSPFKFNTDKSDNTAF